jgi:K(+)-stimulated pyrophosphate-energized sodium pump
VYWLEYTKKVFKHIYLLLLFFGFLFGFSWKYGMKIATKTNVRTTVVPVTTGIKSFFGGGTVMGLGVAGLAVLGLLDFLFSFHYFMNGVWTNSET